jgi:hypothetical protein
MNGIITTKQKILYFIPFVIVVCILLYSWFTFVFTDNLAVASHYLGLVFFAPIIYYHFKDRSFKIPIVLFAFYLILATINLFSIFPFIMSSSIRISVGTITIWTPAINGYSLLILILFGILNFDTLVEVYLDYKESNKK